QPGRAAIGGCRTNAQAISRQVARLPTLRSTVRMRNSEVAPTCHGIARIAGQEHRTTDNPLPFSKPERSSHQPRPYPRCEVPNSACSRPNAADVRRFSRPLRPATPWPTGHATGHRASVRPTGPGAAGVSARPKENKVLPGLASAHARLAWLVG